MTEANRNVKHERILTAMPDLAEKEETNETPRSVIHS